MEITTNNLVAKFKTSGLTQESFCKEHGITPNRLRYYLYKKTDRKTAKKKGPQLSKLSSNFISFNQANSPSSKVYQETGINFTIIHGKFTPKQLAALISELGEIC
jgi:hypothetical protein